MTNLAQVCLFSNLITIPVQWCWFWVSVGEQLFFTGFKVINWGMIKISKRVECQKEGRSVGKEGVQTPLPTIWLWEPKDFVKTNLKLIFQDKFYWEHLKLLRSLGYNENMIQNQKCTSTYCKKCKDHRFCKHLFIYMLNNGYNDPISYSKKNKTHQFKLKLLLLTTNNGSPYCHTFSKANVIFLRNWWTERSELRGEDEEVFFINQNLYHISFMLGLFLQTLH